MSNLAAEIVFKFKGLSPADVWNKLTRSHSDLLERDVMELNGESIGFSSVSAKLQESTEGHFKVTLRSGSLDYSSVANHSLSFLNIEGCIVDMNDANAWIEPFLLSSCFRMGRVYDSEYEFWQNAADPLQYEARGKSYEGLQMCSNGLPFPLEQKVIDTSDNPGRRILRDGFVEAIGSRMWFSEEFWSLTGTVKASINGAASKVRDESGVVIADFYHEPFTCDEAEEGKVQRHIRKILFLIT